MGSSFLIQKAVIHSVENTATSTNTSEQTLCVHVEECRYINISHFTQLNAKGLKTPTYKHITEIMKFHSIESGEYL